MLGILIPVNIHPDKITRKSRELANGLNYDGVGFPVTEKDFSKIETKNNIFINVFCYENRLVFPINIYIKNLKTQWMNEKKSHYAYIKDFDRFMFHKTKNKNKKILL